MDLQIVTVVPDTGRTEAWELYRAAFDELRAVAVQRHLMLRDEFDQVVADPRVDKYVIRTDGGLLCGLGTLTNQLDAMPLISPDYFEQRFPKEYVDNRIWYVGFMAVHPDHRRSKVFRILIESMSRIGADANGVVAMDMCGLNVNAHRLPESVERLLTRLYPRVGVTRLDEQSYWSYEFPVAPVGAAT